MPSALGGLGGQGLMAILNAVKLSLSHPLMLSLLVSPVAQGLPHGTH